MVLKKAVGPEFRVVVACLWLFFALSCASFPGKQIPTIDSQQLVNGQTLKAIDYTASWLQQGRENGELSQLFEVLVDEAFEEASIFESYHIGVGRENVHFDIVMSDHVNVAASSASLFFSLLTIGIIPAYERDNYALTVDVSSDGQLIKKYEYKDHLTFWLGWFVLPAAPGHNPLRISNEVKKNLLRAFFQDLQADGIVTSNPA